MNLKAVFLTFIIGFGEMSLAQGIPEHVHNSFPVPPVGRYGAAMAAGQALVNWQNFLIIYGYFRTEASVQASLDRAYNGLYYYIDDQGFWNGGSTFTNRDYGGNYYRTGTFEATKGGHRFRFTIQVHGFQNGGNWEAVARITRIELQVYTPPIDGNNTIGGRSYPGRYDWVEIGHR